MRKLQGLYSEMSSLWRQHFLKGRKVLRTHSCEPCKRTLSLKIKQTSNPHGPRGRLDQPFFLEPCRFQLPCWWVLTFALCETETSFTHKAQENMLSTGGVKKGFEFKTFPLSLYVFKERENATGKCISAFPAVCLVRSRSELAASDMF